MNVEVRRRGPQATSPEAWPATDRATTETEPTVVTGLDRAIDNAATDWWFQGALLAIKQLGRSGRGFTADHVLDMVGAPTDPHYVGAVFAAAQRQRIVEAVGARVGRDGRLVRVWWGIPT
jgi:hypothetical protein